MEGHGRDRLPSEEELELWARVTRGDEPIQRGERRQATFAIDPVRPTGKAQKPLSQPVDRTKPKIDAPKKAALAADQAPAPFDAKAVRKIARGHWPIDARLDLHGMRQQDAFQALCRFLSKCQEAGYRHVLVITGKGATAGASGRREYWEETPGVLRRLVPQWLSDPTFRAQVVSFTESALQHGGSGALYVSLRKSARSRR